MTEVLPSMSTDSRNQNVKGKVPLNGAAWIPSMSIEVHDVQRFGVPDVHLQGKNHGVNLTQTESNFDSRVKWPKARLN